MNQVDNRIVKASFRQNPPEERKLFPQSTCLMPISVGQTIHEGAKFKAVIKLINFSFKHCTILVDDSVQRHTIGIKINASRDELYQLAVNEGDSWLKRNELAYKQLTIPFIIMRWDDWFNNTHFNESYKRVQQQYNENILYKNAIDANIDDFLSRYLKDTQNITIDYNNAVNLCLDYLLEECAVMCLLTDKLYDFEVYQSGRNKAMAATYEQLIQPWYPNYLKPVALRFKKYPPQNESITIANTINTEAQHELNYL
jgi:hypothetical protein